MTNFKEMRRYFLKILLKIVFHVFWIAPIQRNKITLLNELSFTYGDNLKYIHKALLKEEFLGTFIFPVRTGEQTPSSVKPIKPFSMSYFYHLLTSRVIITNSGGISYLPLRRKQTVINTWHGGGPYKKVGIDTSVDRWYLAEVKMNAENTDYILSSCEIVSKEEFPSMMFSPEKCLNIGVPRNDIFFGTHPEIKKKVFNFYNLSSEDKIVLYSPTYRGNFENYAGVLNDSSLDIDHQAVCRALSARFGGNWIFCLRLHPKLNYKKITYKAILNFSDYPDMQELLYAADVVITDYSSLMWDFSLTGRPCFLFAQDLEEYVRTRGFYMHPSQWPYPIAHDNKELEQKILEFDKTIYQERVKQHHLESGSYEKGTACQAVINLLRERTEPNLWKV